MLEQAQQSVREISGEFHERTITTPAFFHSLLAEQFGQAAHAYVHWGRRAFGVEVDIADIIVCCLAYLNWTGMDASEAFEKALAKHMEAIEDEDLEDWPSDP